MNALSTRKSDKSKRLGMKHYSILRISTITEIQTTQKKLLNLATCDTIWPARRL